MPRGSRHKSSKHSTRDAREYSDSEKETYLRERKGKEDGGSSSSCSRHLKDSRSGVKQKLDSKPVGVSTKLIGLGNAENNDDFGGVVLSTSRKRKEKADDDRWTGGDDSNEIVMLKSEMKEKEEVRGPGESKRSSRRAANYVSGIDVEEGKKSGSKAESKHHHKSERKERGEREGGSERERKGSRSERLVDIVSVSENKASKGNKKQSCSGEEHGGMRSGGKADKVNSEKLVDIVSVSENTGSEGTRKQSGEERGGKHSFGNTDCSVQEELKNPESERDLDRRLRRKRDGSGDLDRHHVVRDVDDRRLSSREEIMKSGKYKDDVRRDERNRDRFHEDIDKDVWCQDEKQRDYRSTRDHTSGKLDDKHLRNGKKDLDLTYKKSMPHSGEYERESDHDRQRDRDYDRNQGRDRDRKHDDRDHDRDHDRAQNRDREPDRNRDHGTDRYRHEHEVRGRGGVQDQDQDRGRNWNFDRENDNEYPLHADEKGSRYADDRGRRRSLDGYDDYHTDKLRRVKTEVDKERSLTHKPNIEIVKSSSQCKPSPSSRAYGGADIYRDGIQDETKYVDTLWDATMPEKIDRSPKYWSGEKRAKCDDNHIGEFSERSLNTRVSPDGLKGRSPSMSVDRSGFSSRNTRRRSLDVDEAEKRTSGSNDVRDIGVTEDRQQNLPSNKFSGDEYPLSESPFYHKNKSGQGYASSHGPSPGQSVFRTRADSPSFASSFGEDSRGPGRRYRRSVDPNVVRGPGNAWNSVPNWPSPLPNGFIPFPPGPPGPHHGGFPPMMSQFPPIYGVRPTLDINHQGIPYHLADGDRFQGHAHPIGWPNMVEGSMPPHFRGWDTGNGMLRDDSLMYGPGYLAQRRDMNSDIWKLNGDMNMDVISGSQKHVPTVKAFTDEASMSVQGGASKPNVESSCLDDQATSFKKDVSSGQSPIKEILLTPAKGTTDKTPESSGVDDAAQLLRAYLAKLDISMDLADPELYNQCINLSTEGESEYLEDEVELEYMNEKDVLMSEIMNLTVDMKNLPAAEESIYQRAMNLYMTQSSERSYAMPELENTSVQKENMDSAVDGSLQPEDQTLMLPNEIVPEIGDIEPPVSLTGEEVLNVRPLQNTVLAHVACETQMPVLDVDIMVEETNPELIPVNSAADKIALSIENTNQGPVISNTDDQDIVIDGHNTVSIDSVPEEQSDFAVSGPLNLCNDSVEVCEGLTSVSNESKSVVLSRIHHAPESTY